MRPSLLRSYFQITSLREVWVWPSCALFSDGLAFSFSEGLAFSFSEALAFSFSDGLALSEGFVLYLIKFESSAQVEAENVSKPHPINNPINRFVFISMCPFLRQNPSLRRAAPGSWHKIPRALPYFPWNRFSACIG